MAITQEILDSVIVGSMATASFLLIIAIYTRRMDIRNAEKRSWDAVFSIWLLCFVSVLGFIGISLSCLLAKTYLADIPENLPFYENSALTIAAMFLIIEIGILARIIQLLLIALKSRIKEGGFDYRY